MVILAAILAGQIDSYAACTSLNKHNEMFEMCFVSLTYYSRLLRVHSRTPVYMFPLICSGCCIFILVSVENPVPDSNSGTARSCSA